MDHAVIIHRGEPRRASVLAHAGDWAVTLYASDVGITHLPTGARLPAAGTAGALCRALPDLGELPRFDLQGWDEARGAVQGVLRKHGLVR